MAICKICVSPNVHEYEKLYLEDKYSYTELWKYAKIQKNEDLPYDSFRRHMKLHVKAIIEAGKEFSDLQVVKMKEEIDKTIEISKNLRMTLEPLQSFLQNKIENLSDETDRQYLEVLFRGLSEIRQIYKLILEHEEQLDMGPQIDKDRLYDQVIECLIEAEIPDIYIFKFSKAWEQREK